MNNLQKFIKDKGGVTSKSSFKKYIYTCVEGDDYPVGQELTIIIFTGDYTSNGGKKYVKGDYLIID
jgi:hypothetical protein